MPYIILRRNDIPDGVLQTLDLRPNTSQRKFPYETSGQTGYRDYPEAEMPVLTGAFAFDADTTGIAAWILANVSSGDGVIADGSITTDVVGTFSDGDNFQVSDGTTVTTFEFGVTAGHGVTPPRVLVDLSAAVTADNVRDAIIAAVNGVADFNILATSGGAGTVVLRNLDENISAALRNVAITDSGIGGAWATVGMVNATDSAALTAAEAWADAGDIATQALAGGALDLATLNGLLTTGTITASQLSDVLDLMADRTYTVPAGTVVQAAGAFTPAGAATFFEDDIRRIYMTGPLRISLGEGRLALATSAAFTYDGVAGAAVQVYNDDGSIFTVPA